MLANWVQESTPTTGTGTTIALGGAAAGYVPFSSRFTDQQSVTVTFTDGNNRQVAICTYNVTGNTLTINTLLEQLVSGVLTLNPATPISLSGSATVGIDSTTISEIDAFISGFNGTGSNNGFDYGLVTNATVAYGTTTANTMVLTPQIIPYASLVSTLGFNVSTADSAATYGRLGLFRADKSGKPAELLFDSGDISALLTTTGVKSVALAAKVFVPPGAYYRGYVSNSTTAALYSIQPVGFGGSATGGYQSLLASGITGALASHPTITGAQGRYITWGWQ